jgi:hypothetical protein
MDTAERHRDAAESWFLARGLPAVLTVRARWRHVWPRSAPALTAYATIVSALLVVYLLIGTSEVYVDGAPTPVERIVLTVIALAVPLGALLGWLVSRVRRLAQSVIAMMAVVVSIVTSLIQGGIAHLLVTFAVIAIILALTASGVGAVLSWATRLTGTQLAAMGALFVRALPVVLLTVVVFFNPYAWAMAATTSQARLGLALTFLLTITAAFVVSATFSWVRPMLDTASASHGGAHELTGTPFASGPDPAVADRLTRGEHLNVVVVLAAAQLTHLMMVAVSTAAIYFVLGLIVLSPRLLAKWSDNGPSDGTVLGMTIPVPQSLIHMTLILCVLTFMYVSAKSVADNDYKSRFLDPLIEDLHVTLIARNRYRASTT